MFVINYFRIIQGKEREEIAKKMKCIYEVGVQMATTNIRFMEDELMNFFEIFQLNSFSNITGITKSDLENIMIEVKQSAGEQGRVQDSLKRCNVLTEQFNLRKAQFDDNKSKKIGIENKVLKEDKQLKYLIVNLRFP